MQLNLPSKSRANSPSPIAISSLGSLFPPPAPSEAKVAPVKVVKAKRSGPNASFGVSELVEVVPLSKLAAAARDKAVVKLRLAWFKQNLVSITNQYEGKGIAAALAVLRTGDLLAKFNKEPVKTQDELGADLKKRHKVLSDVTTDELKKFVDCEKAGLEGKKLLKLKVLNQNTEKALDAWDKLETQLKALAVESYTRAINVFRLSFAENLEAENGLAPHQGIALVTAQWFAYAQTVLTTEHSTAEEMKIAQAEKKSKDEADPDHKIKQLVNQQITKLKQELLGKGGKKQAKKGKKKSKKGTQPKPNPASARPPGTPAPAPLRSEPTKSNRKKKGGKKKKTQESPGSGQQQQERPSKKKNFQTRSGPNSSGSGARRGKNGKGGRNKTTKSG